MAGALDNMSGVTDKDKPLKAKAKKVTRRRTRKAPSRPKMPKRRFDRAERVIDFIELLTIPSGIGAGTRFVLEPFQKKFIRDVYAEWAPSWKRKVRRAILSIGRKNGKTALIAALVLCHLIGPEAIRNAEIYSVANDKEQAGQVFKMAAQMVRLEPDLEAFLKIVDSTKTITCHGNGSFYKAMSSESGTKHGLNPVVWIYDELAQSRNTELYDTFDTSQGAQVEPLGLVISTQSDDPQHALSKLIDDGLSGKDPTIVCHLYTVPEDTVDIFNPKCWKKANPALDVFRSREDFEALASAAYRNPSRESAFRNLYLNQRVNIKKTIFTRRQWSACKGKAIIEPGEEIILSLDYAGTTDLAALVALSMDRDKPARLLPHFWKPEDYLEEHGRRDRVLYPEWYDAGFLEPCPGPIIAPDYITEKIAYYWENYSVTGLVYDRYRIEYILLALDRADIPAQKGPGYGLNLMPWGQGFVSMSPALEAFENLVLTEDFVHNDHPVMNWNISNAIVKNGPGGNRKFDKEKVIMRIDGAQAAAQAAGMRASIVTEAAPPSSPWDNPEFSINPSESDDG